MKTLGLLRHAKSDWDDMSLRDYDRGLNDRGRRGAAIMGGHIRAHGVSWDLLLASPAERVKRTLDATRLKLPTRWDERVYLADGDVRRARAGGRPLGRLPAGLRQAGPPRPPARSRSRARARTGAITIGGL